MKARFNLFLVNSLIVILAIIFSTSLFLAQIQDDAIDQVKKSQEEALQTLWQLIRDKGADFRIVDGKLMAGDYVLNDSYELPDKIREIFSVTATIFMGDTRVATNVLNADGSRAVGTKLSGPAHDVIFKENRPYRGEAAILGVPHFTAYDPIKNRSGETIGVLYVGINKSEFFTTYNRLKYNIIAGSIVIAFLFSAIGFVLLRERNRYEELLKESEQKYRTLFTKMLNGFALHEVICDAAGKPHDYRFLEVNYAFEAITGLKREALIGRTVREVIPGIEEDWIERFGAVALTGQPDHFVNFAKELDSWYEVSAYSPMRGQFAVSFTDVTERKKAEDRIEELAAQMRLITDSVPVNIAYVDEELRYRFVNRGYEEWFDLPREEIVGRSVEEMRSPADFARIRSHVEKALAGERVAFVNEIVKRDGSIAFHLASYVPHMVEDRVIGFFVLVSDITASRQAEESIRASEERYRTVFNTTGTATFISEEDTTVSLVNDEFLRLSGFAREEVEGLLSWTEFVTPDSSEKMLIYHHARRLDPASAPHAYECEAIWRDGSLRNMMAHVNLIPGTGRSIISFLDITGHKQLEEGLQSQLAFLQTLINTIPSPVFYKDRAGRYTGCNLAFSKYLGGAHVDLVGKTVYDLAPRDMADRYTEMDEELFNNPGIQVYDSSVIYADGSRHEVTFNKATFSSTDGKIEGLVGVMIDLTERNQAEKWLAGEKSALEMIVQNAPFADVLELLCKNFEEQFPGALCSILLFEENGRRLRHIAAPSLPEEYVRAIDGTRIGPMVGSCGTAAFTRQVVITADIATDPHWEKYRSLPLKFGLQSSWSMPVCSSKGAILGTFAVYNPAPHKPDTQEQQLVKQAAHLASIIIERNRNEAELRESEERFHQIFAQNFDAIILFRIDDLSIIDANPKAQELTGFTLRELNRFTFTSILAPEDFLRLMNSMSIDDHTRGLQLDKGVCTRKDGSTAYVSIWSKIIMLRDKSVVYCSIRDITEKVRLEEEIRTTQAKLIHANKMTSIGMLASSVAHEINNPNNCISVNTAMLADVWKDAEPLLKAIHEEQGEFMLRGIPFTKMQEFAPRLLDGIREGSRRITAIVQNMRDYVREDKSGCHGSIDINLLLQNAIAILWHHIHIHTDNFTTKLDEDLPPARGNGQQVEQVLINLITNALQALPDKKSGVHVTTGMENGKNIIIKVRDDGKGMDETTLARLTEPFFTTRTDDGGTGLGLYISESILKEHEGTLEFQSAPGMGTTAICRLPLAEETWEMHP